MKKKNFSHLSFNEIKINRIFFNLYDMYLNWWILSIPLVFYICWPWAHNSQIVNEAWTQRLSLLFGHFSIPCVLKLLFQNLINLKRENEGKWKRAKWTLNVVTMKQFKWWLLAWIPTRITLIMLKKENNSFFCVMSSRLSGRHSTIVVGIKVCVW